jgi:hypothetical protein
MLSDLIYIGTKTQPKTMSTNRAESSKPAIPIPLLDPAPARPIK